MEEPVIIFTSDGSHTLFLSELKESYHSVNGAISESEHVYLNNGYRFSGLSGEISILEIGFGTGLNCLLTAMEAEKSERYTRYFTIEKFPLTEKIIRSLNYPELAEKGAPDLFRKIHESPWEIMVSVSPFFELRKIRADALTFPVDDIPEIDLIYFDAFGPEKQPDIWSIELFEKIFRKMKVNGVFVTYSAKGSVRRDLQNAGFRVERLPGPAGKREMLRGIKSN